MSLMFLRLNFMLYIESRDFLPHELCTQPKLLQKGQEQPFVKKKITEYVSVMTGSFQLL